VSLTTEQRDELIRHYAEGPARFRAALARIPAEALRFRPGPGKWSAHQVVVHCADSETNAAMRIRFVLAEKSPTIMGYDQDTWAEVLDYETHPVELALATIDAVRANTLPLLRRQAAPAWMRAGTHTESGPYSAETWLQVYASHLETHARQLERNLAAWKAKAPV
jgi:hypothetical protein